MRIACLAVVALTMGGTVGCSGDPVGNWQSREELPNGKRNKLFLGDGDLKEDSDLRLYGQITTQAGLTKFEYDVEDWFVEADGAYEVQLKCTDGCDVAILAGVNPDFEMDCEYDSGNEWLDCEAKSPWKDYGFLEFELEPDE